MSLLEKELELFKSHTPYVKILVTHIQGSAPQIVGAKMLIGVNGLIAGTIGGGKIEHHCVQYAKSLLEQNDSNARSETWNLQTDIGMTCGGVVTIFFEPTIQESWNLVIFGAGHISQELCRVLTTWSCRVQVFDTRKEWIDKLPKSHNIVGAVAENMTSQIREIPNRSFILCMTMGHASDVPVLKAVFDEYERFKFIGLIGSEVKAKKVKQDLLELGVSEQKLVKLICPVGLPIGDNTPPQISVSILAQILTERRKNL